jgi:uncharacterized membrane protein YqaE (UPF0057 family)
MHYLLAILLPPVAVLTAGFRPISFVFSILLTLCLWVPGIVHAILVVNEHKADKRMSRQTKAIIEGKTG